MTNLRVVRNDHERCADPADDFHARSSAGRPKFRNDPKFRPTLPHVHLNHLIEFRTDHTARFKSSAALMASRRT
jgi:hypothetical protein